MTTDAPARTAPSPNGRPGEPEKLLLPAAVLEELVQIALRTELGAFGWRVFTHAHGDPSWLAPGRFRVAAQDAALLPVRSESEEE